MWVNWKRFSFGALLLASLSLLLFGCGDYSGGGSQTAQKSISGVVSDPVTGLALADATVTVYAIDANGVRSNVPLSIQSVQTDSKGRYRIFIPAGYNGAVIVEATKGNIRIQAAVPQNLISAETIPPVMVSLATNMVLQYLAASNSPLTSDNIRKANIVLETYFGPNFSQIPPPTSATDVNTTRAQQDLLVSIRAMNSFPNGPQEAAAALAQSGGIGATADKIKLGIANAIAALKAQGLLPPEYQANAAIIAAISNAQFAKVPVPSLGDNTPPAAPTGLSVGATTAKSVTLNWTRSSSADVAGYLVYRADASGIYLPVGSVGPAAATFIDFLALPSSTYSYQVAAFDASRNFSGVSNTVTVTTPPATDILPPTAPQGLVCTGFSDTQVNLKWLQSTKTRIDGTVIPAARYNVYRNGEFLASTVETSYIDFAVTANTSYTYYVKASDADSNLSPASLPVTVRTSVTPGAVRPAAPTGLALSGAVLFNKVPLTWAASATASVTYNVYRDGILIVQGIAGRSYNDDSVFPRTSYVYTVTAVANRIESAESTPLTVVTPANPNITDNRKPATPTNLSVLSVTSNSVALAWTAPNNPAGPAVVGYDVLRSGGSSSTFVKVATVFQPAYTDTNNVQASTSYSYTVQSFTSAGVRSDSSLPVGVITPARIDLNDTTKPNPPANLALAGPTRFDSVPLIWSAATKPNADATHFVAGYLVYRDGSQLADVHNQLSFTDITTTGSTTYVYTVKAYDNSGNISDPSNALSVTTPAPVPNSFTIFGKVTLNGVGLPGVILTNSVTSAQVVTDANGDYSFFGLPAGTYIITPRPASFIQFIPVRRTVTINANRFGVDFAAVLTGAASGGVIFPNGTVIGGISFPSGTVIGGVTYPAGTIVGGVFYPTGTVIGGIVYPNGVVIGGVTYPAGTVVGGIAFPAGVVTSGVSFPSGTVIGGISFPAGTVIGGVTYPAGTIIGGVFYPTGTVVGGTVYPDGVVIGGVTYPAGTVVGGIAFPVGAVNVGVTTPSGTVIGGVVYPAGSVVPGVTYPTGVVVSGVTYPSGVVAGGVLYPIGGVTSGVSFPTGNVTGEVLYPAGAVTGGASFPAGGASGGNVFPSGIVFSTGILVFPL